MTDFQQMSAVKYSCSEGASSVSAPIPYTRTKTDTHEHRRVLQLLTRTQALNLAPAGANHTLKTLVRFGIFKASPSVRKRLRRSRSLNESVSSPGKIVYTRVCWDPSAWNSTGPPAEGRYGDLIIRKSGLQAYIRVLT